MITLPSLYPHQESQRDRAREALARCGRIILNAPTGCGKTRMAKWILGASANREPSSRQSGNSLFTVHRRGLVDNAIDSFAEDPPLPHGVIMSGRDATYGRRIQVASIDTMLSWFVEDNAYQADLTFDLIVWDEAHSHHPKFAKLLKLHDARRKELGLHPAFVIGLTATPQAEGLADVYREIVPGPPTQWLIDNNYLSRFRYVSGTPGKLGLLVRRGGEFTEASEAAAMDGLAGDLVRDWLKYASGRPTVGFFPRRTHAQDALEQFSQAGLRVEYIDGNTSDEARKRIFRELQHHDIDYLCNVQVVERGTDVPRIGCVQLCVAIGSIPRYRQMIGRGSRCHPDKTDCLILDHGGNVKRHGFFEDDPRWSLTVVEKPAGEGKSRPTIECPSCHAIYRGGQCRNCGYEPTPRERMAQGLEFDGSELHEVVRKDATPKSIKTPEQLMVSSLYAAGRSNRTFNQAVAMYLRAAAQQGTVEYAVPRTVLVAGHRYRMIPYGHPDGKRRVESLYPFVRGRHGGDYLVSAARATESLF